MTKNQYNKVPHEIYFLNNLTEEQESIANYDKDELLVRGVAGSGKTLSLLKNALNKSTNNQNSILFITFNKSLRNKLHSLWDKEKKENNSYGKIEVRNFHSFAYEYWPYKYPYKYQDKKLEMFKYDNEKKLFLRKVLSNLTKSDSKLRRSRLRNYSNENLIFLGEEFDFIKGKNIRSIDEYKKTKRIGRGIKKLNNEDREVVYSIFEKFEEFKREELKFEFIDFAYQIFPDADFLKQYDYVYIDEAQDLNQVEIHLLRKIVKKGFYVAADEGQKIYKRNYNWSDIGVNFRGSRVKKLHASFRSPHEIFVFASELQKNDSSLAGEKYVDPKFNPKFIGDKPTVKKSNNILFRNTEIVKRINNYLSNNSNKNVAILLRDRYSIKKIQKALREGKLYANANYNDQEIDFTEQINIITIHSSKGLEFDYVIIPEFTEKKSVKDDEKDENYWNDERKLWYVAFSRARHKLDVMYTKNPHKLLEEIDEKLYYKIELD